jgi:hypothetical protein
LTDSETVASDKWLVAHFDESWKVSEVKRYILSKATGKATGSQLYQPPRNRPVSPITFASIRPPPSHTDDSASGTSAQSDANDDSWFDDGEDDDDDNLSSTTHYPGGRSGGTLHFDSPQDLIVCSTPTERFPLITFSTGQLLDDSFSLSWYKLRPNELLELHPHKNIIRLPRNSMTDYIQPYFECRVKALRALTHDDHHPTKRRDVVSEPRSPTLDRIPLQAPLPKRKKKTKLEWRDRWLVISQGRLNLYKGKTVSYSSSSSLSSVI